MASTARTKDGVFGIVIDDVTISQIDRLCMAAGDVETGGIIIGRYSDDRSTAIIVEATSAPTDSRGGRLSFVRGVKGLGGLLRTRWRSKERTYYLGEWHFHPATVIEPSTQDFREMAQIAAAVNYRCKEPILMIFAKRLNVGDPPPVRAFVCPVGREPLELVNGSLS